jgi:hypothetical protein
VIELGLAVSTVAVTQLGCGSNSANAPGAAGAAGAVEASDAGTTDANLALHFDGVHDYATTGTANMPKASVAQTISMWVRIGSVAATDVFLSLRLDDEASGINLGVQDGGLSAWNVYGNPTVTVDGTFALAALPSLNAWHHVAVVYDGAGLVTLYTDGSVVASGPARPSDRTPSALWVGSLDGASEFYAGDMDEIRIWNIARTAGEILDEMQGNVASNAPGLVAYFNCDGVVGTRIPDLSGNGNDMTLGGGVPAMMPTFVTSTVP